MSDHDDDDRPDGGPWSPFADPLARWAADRLVNRDDRCGGYYRQGGEVRRTTRPGNGPRPGFVTPARLARHFRAARPEDVVGLHPLGPDSAGRWLAVDIDAHDDRADPAANRRYALALYDRLVALGFRPLLYASNGAGGYHLWVLLDRPVPGADLFAFGRWLVRDHREYELANPPEVFPKQPRLTATAAFGNWLRLPGRHHTRDYWAAVFDGTEWLVGGPAARHLLTRTGDDPGLIPAEGRTYAPPPAGVRADRAGCRRGGDGPDVFAAYNAAQTLGSVAALLARHGWTHTGTRGERWDFKRPGKRDGGESGNLVLIDGVPVFYAFTNASDLPERKGLNPSQIRARLEFAGSFRLLAAQLRKEGFGPAGASGGWGGPAAPPRAGEPDAATAGEEPPPPAAGDEAAGPVNVDPTDPYLLAADFLRDRFTDPADVRPGLRLVVHQEEVFRYDRGRFAVVPRAEHRAAVGAYVDGRLAEHHRRELAEWAAAGGKGKPPRKAKTTAKVVSDVVEAVAALRCVSGTTTPPAWLDGRAGPDPRFVVPVANGLLDLTAAADGRPDGLLPRTPLFFSRSAVPFAYDPAAPAPRRWLQFLAEVFPDDPDSVLCLQEWFGYLLTGDTSLQKLLLLLGARRGGKGTILRVLAALLGPENVSNPALHQFASEFGLWPLIGKRAAVVSDVRLGRQHNRATIVQNLLRVVGEDDVLVNRKHLSMIDGRLPVRLVLAANGLPDLPDEGGALDARYVPLRFTRSFVGREDPHLTDKLKAELPGILVWAVEGWRRLRASGQFTRPASGMELGQEIADLNSPVGKFVAEMVVVDVRAKVPCSELYGVWQDYTERRGMGEEREWSVDKFGAELLAAVPTRGRKQFRVGKPQVWHYTGLRLRLPEDDADEGAGEQPDRDEPGVDCGCGACVICRMATPARPASPPTGRQSRRYSDQRLTD